LGHTCSDPGGEDTLGTMGGGVAYAGTGTAC
jgi:hypothetical protein